MSPWRMVWAFFGASPIGGMIILVSGQMRPSDNKERNFSQVFVLEKKMSAANEFYVIKRDMLQALEVPELEQEVIEEIEETPIEEEEVAAEPEEVIEEKEAPAFTPEVPVELEVVEEVPVVVPAAEVSAEPEPEAQPEVQPAAEPVEPEVTAEAQPEAESVEPVEPVLEQHSHYCLSAVEAQPVAEVVIKAEEPAAEAADKKAKKPVSHAYRNRANQFTRRHEVKREEPKKSDDDFVVVKSRYTAKTSNHGSTLYVKFSDASVNKESLIQVFKVGVEGVCDA